MTRPTGAGTAPLIAVAALVAAAGAARADDCDTVYAAFAALAEQPAYSQEITLPNQGPVTTVAVGDMLYVREGGEWEKVDLGAGGRQRLMKSAIPSATLLRDCKAEEEETFDGRETRVFRYIPPPIQGVEQGPQRLWIDADGLPRRMLAEDGSADVTLVFDGVTAPVP